MFQPEETVTYVPATYTPDFVYVPDNVYPVYYPVYYTMYPVYCPVYEPVYYHDLTPDFYPKPLTVETAVEECFLPSPQPPQDLQPVLPKWEPTLTTIQEHNDKDQDITVNMFLGGRAMFQPENVFVPQNVSPPEPASSPEALPETLYPHLSEPQLASDLPTVQTDNAASIDSSPLLLLTWGQFMDAMDAELEEAEKHKEQEVSKEKESYELLEETFEEECFLPYPQPPQDQQPVLPKWEPTLTTIQEHDDEDQDITVNKLLGGRAMFPPETVFVPQNVTPPEPASPPEALPETLSPPLSEPHLASDLLPVQTDNAASIDSSPLLPLTWGQILDALDAELEEAEKHKEQEVSKEKESYELLEEKREKVIEKKDKIEDVIDKKEKVEELDKKKKIEQRKKTADVRKRTFAYSTQNPKGVELFIRGLDFKIDKQRLYKLFHPFGNIIRAKLMTKNGQSKGYGYITYSSDAEAKTAIREMNGKIVGSKLLNITLSKTEEERAQQKMGSGWKRRT
ncbi:RNA-binding protein 42-like isoform X1 [Tachysurus fulvidraco]|uniref:RNA-binding protein 42-like isoform X1 n=1 Tax=Tachysurus fulvidraco TaxID=1234273 RepID=UPI001FEE9F43|nr:RNA-binding protein 42-like isoform X1 [Tachysurus fulvidraco]